MFNYIWPLLIIVFSNTLYQICAKGIPAQMNTYASMTVTYAVATVVLGIVITGLEIGFIFAYKAGWKVSTLATLSNALLAVILVFVGRIGYHEAISWSKILGVAICLVGLYFINRK